MADSAASDFAPPPSSASSGSSGAVTTGFLAETNVCGQTILRLCCRANAIVAELNRLSGFVPAVFKMQDKNTQKKYSNIVFDFSYLKGAELYEHRISNSAELMDLDEEFRDTHMELLERFYGLFESIFKYAKDFVQFTVDLEEGVFIQNTLEQVLLDIDGKQLVCEALYMYGVILLLMDELLPGIVRERLLISVMRYRGEGIEDSDLGDLSRLIGQTGYSAGGKRPAKYPDEYFARIRIPEHVVNMVIGRLRSDDVYNASASYPLPVHRSAALANQASMLYVALYFAPDILHNKVAVMREVVDKHFPDNWVIPLYMGHTVDLSDVWQPYTAAKKALANTLQPKNIQEQKAIYWGKAPAVMATLAEYLSEGVLTEEFLLENVHKLLAAVREANVVIRWIMLHTNTTDKKAAGIVKEGVDQEYVLRLLLDTAQYEFVLKRHFQALLDSKESRWNKLRTECVERMQDLSEYFSGEKALTRGVKKNEVLMRWFADTGAKISQLDYTDSVLAGRKIHQLIQALLTVEEYQEMQQSLHIRQFLIDTRNFLQQMLRIVNIREEVMVTMSIVGDMGYAWHVIRDYVSLMQNRIKREPGSVLKLRATFLKLASVLDLPLIRIMQAQSPDLASVSEYYSGELVSFVRTVLEIVPRSMFEVLRQMIELQTRRLRELPTKLTRDELVDLAQMDQRFELAALTHRISVFTEGILAMETTLVGVIQVDPRQLLEDGIRKQLVLQIAGSLHEHLQFTPASSRKGLQPQEFSERLQRLQDILGGIRRSFQYIQDYVNIYGLKVWQEEFWRIINFNIEQECNAFLKTTVYDWDSEYQSKAIPIPRFPPTDADSVNFIGRLARALLELTDPQKTIYLEPLSAWFDAEGREVVGIRTFDTLLKSVDVFGLAGLDKLLSFMIVTEIQKFVIQCRRMVVGNKDLRTFCDMFSKSLGEPQSIPTGRDPNAKDAVLASANAIPVPKMYSEAQTKLGVLWPLFLQTSTRVGQMQLLRRQTANTLQLACKVDAASMHASLAVMNVALLQDIKAHYSDPEHKPYPSDDSLLLLELGDYLDLAGMSDPLLKIYITTRPLDFLPLLLFTFVSQYASNFTYDAHLSTLVHRKDKRAFDGAPFVVGIISMLKQFHSSETAHFLAYLGQYVRAMVNTELRGDKAADVPAEAIAAMLFLEDFCKFASIDRAAVESFIPSYLFSYFKH